MINNTLTNEWFRTPDPAGIPYDPNMTVSENFKVWHSTKSTLALVAPDQDFVENDLHELLRRR